MADPPFVIGVLSRHRPELVRRCVSSVLALAGEPVLVVVAFDDDPSGFSMFPEYPNTVKVLLAPRHYYCAGMNELYLAMKRAAEPHGGMDYFGVTNDDVEFLAPLWPARSRQFLLDKFLDGEGLAEFVEFDKCAHYVSRVGFIDRHMDGRLSAPGYVMYCSDSEMLARSRALGRYSFMTDPKHLGRFAIHHEVWDTSRWECRTWYSQDRALFDSRFGKPNG